MLSQTIVYVIGDFEITSHETYTQVDWVVHRQATGLIPYYCHKIWERDSYGFKVIIAIDSRLEKEPAKIFVDHFGNSMLSLETGESQ